MAYVNLAHMPDPAKEYAINFFDLSGGLNLSELEQSLKSRESPEMWNLIWRDGVLGSRDGQEWATKTVIGTAYSMYERMFHGHLFAHIGAKLYHIDPDAETPAWTELCSGVPTSRGTWFHYYDNLYYKNKGGYFCITYTDGNPGTFSGEAVAGYIPILQINSDPDTAAGDLYQPENRIQAAKTVKYNAKVDSDTQEPVAEYHLPVASVTSVDEVIVDGVLQVEGEDEDYTVSLTDGVVTFNTGHEPTVTNPPTNNTVEITYSKANTDAYNSVMNCPYAATYGGTGDLCVVVGGCPAQPNAIFWNANNIAMDPTYFPVDNYQLCGDTDDMVTGFGKQQSFLVVFKEHSIGRVKQNLTEVDGRSVIDMPYAAINDKIGCDLPWTIQLIDNNLVWCNTEQGVHILKDSSYAYENNIECVSSKVNRSATSRYTLLRDVRYEGTVCSFDDEKHYWLCAHGHVWLWDYEYSTYREPSWFLYTNVAPVALASEQDKTWHVNENGQLTRFIKNYRDYDKPINKRYRFPVQYFGGYDRLKNVNSTIITLRSNTSTLSTLTYITDYETRKDLTDLGHAVWSLIPRDLSFRNLAGSGFGAVFRRRPMCRRVRHFCMQLDNNGIDQDLAIVSAQIFYNYQGRLR